MEQSGRLSKFDLINSLVNTSRVIGMKHLRLFKFIGLWAILALYSGFSTQDIHAPAFEVSTEELARHVQYLASEELEGRRAGTAEAVKAATYIAKEFSEYGLYTASGETSISADPSQYFQSFQFTSGIEYGSGNSLVLYLNNEEHKLGLNSDFRTLPFSSVAEISAPVLFAGFGISSPGDNYDDYSGADPTGRIVLVFDGSPDQNDPHGALNQYNGARTKAIAAREAGAKGLILVTQPDSSDRDRLLRIRLDRSFGSAGIPVINITERTADLLFGYAGHTASGIYDNLIETKQPNSFDLNGLTATVTTDLFTITSDCRNVIGYLPGSDPALAHETIVIGAHFDHLGWGGEGSMLPDNSDIHYGADDNASGTAGLLELARLFGTNRDTLKRSILFIAFGAEELGLIGSQYYVNNPLYPIEHTTAMINLDMVGRMRDNELTVFGTGTSPVWDELLQRAEGYADFTVRTNPDGMGPSDHASFYTKTVPVLFFHTGLHENYHRPSDTHDLINYPDLSRIVQFVYNVAHELDNLDSRPQYAKVETPRPSGAMRGIRVYVGTMPDYVGESGGLKITGVREGSPAAHAGIVAGDVIVNFGGIKIENVYDYTYALGEFKPGEKIEVVIKRSGEEIAIELELASRPR